MVGKETELDRTLLEAIKDPLTHLVRNAVDHGIESPDGRGSRPASPPRASSPCAPTTRAARSSSRSATTAPASTPRRSAAKAVERGLRTQAQVAADDADRHPPADLPPRLLDRGRRDQRLRPRRRHGRREDQHRGHRRHGRRGVGRRPRHDLPAAHPADPGDHPGAHRRVRRRPLRHPAGQPARAGRARRRPRDATPSRTSTARRSTACAATLLPLVRLARASSGSSPRADQATSVIAVLQADGKRFGLVVDRGPRTPRRSSSSRSAPQLKAIGIYAGATILGDGQVALILDVQALARRALDRRRPRAGRRRRPRRPRAVAADEPRLLVAGIGGGRQVAIPLSSVTRLENFASRAVERVGGREVVQYRGGILPVVRLDRLLGADRASRASDDLVVVVYTRGDRSVAIVVDEIVDIVDDGRRVRTPRSTTTASSARRWSATAIDRACSTSRAAILSADPTFYDDAADVLARRPRRRRCEHARLVTFTLDGRAVRRRRRRGPGGPRAASRRPGPAGARRASPA